MTKRTLLMLLAAHGWLLSSVYGQSDYLLWAQVDIDYTNRAQQWGVALLGNLFLEDELRVYQQAYGLLHVYINPNPYHRLQLGYLNGDLGKENALHELRLRYFCFLPTQLQPYVRLSAERVWTPPYVADAAPSPVNDRLRALVGARYGRNLFHHTASVEAFVVQQPGWWQEVRTYVGSSYLPSDRWTALIAYYGRYTTFLTAPWQHHLVLGLRFHLAAPSDSRSLPHHD